MNLSKSQYTKYRSCPKRLWLYRNKKEVLTPPDAAQQKIFDRGHFIGEFAWKRFPSGVLVKDGYKNPQEAIKRTQELMAQGVLRPPSLTTVFWCLWIFWKKRQLGGIWWK